MLDGVYVSDLMKVLETLPHPDLMEEDSFVIHLTDAKFVQTALRNGEAIEPIGNLHKVKLKKAWDSKGNSVWVFCGEK